MWGLAKRKKGTRKTPKTHTQSQTQPKNTVVDNFFDLKAKTFNTDFLKTTFYKQKRQPLFHAPK